MLISYGVVSRNESALKQEVFMSHSWKQSIFIDQKLASTLIEDQTNLRVDTIFLIGEGWDNLAYLVNNRYIFRFPRRPMGVDCMQNEIAILPYIAEHVSFPFSAPTFIGHSTKEYAAPFSGYEMLSGHPLSENEAEPINETMFAKKLAIWLRKLHSVPVRQADYSSIKGEQDWRYDVNQRSERVMGCLKKYESFYIDAGFNIERLLKALDYFQSYSGQNIPKSSYCHGDLYSKHILVDSFNELSGIIDWGDIHIGNPGSDLSIGFMIFSDTALQSFFESYGAIDTISYELALFRAFWHPIILLPYCFEMNEERLKKWTILALKRTLLKLNKGDDSEKMSAKDVVELLQLFQQNGIEVFVDGGWGVDALLGKQTRLHTDLDIAL